MLIGVVSDTHGHLPRTQQAVSRLTDLGVELVLHCGDVGSPQVIEALAQWPVHFVFGNVDDPSELREAIGQPGRHCHERFGKLEILGKKIAFLHGDDGKLLRQTVQSGTWDLVCYGHTHSAEITTHGRTLLVNPGALYRAPQPTLAVVDLPGLRATLLTVG